MHIYKTEIDDGLSEAIAATTSLAFISRLEESQPETDSVKLEGVMEALSAHLGERPERDTYDLFPVKTILVSTGWNANDDVFTSAEVWAGRHSPEDKPFNLEHVPRHIIGHITNNVGVDEDIKVIDDDITLEDLPEKLHVVTSAVIYRHPGNRDTALTEEAAEIIAGIQNGDWFVSMECLFDGFDYGLRDLSTGKHNVIARQESTAFLTKHLRAYKGTGQYNGCSVGRVLRNITFIGKGLVERPANPESEFIFNDIEAFAGKLNDVDTIKMVDSVEEISEIDNSEAEVNSTDVGVDTVDETENTLNDKVTQMSDDRIKELESELAETRAQLAEFDAKALEAKFEIKDVEIAQHVETIATLTTQVEESKELVVKANEATATIEKTLVEKTKEADEAVAELDTIKAEATKVDRTSTLVDKGLEKEKAEKIVAEFIELNDEKFAAVADLIEVPETVVSEVVEEEVEEEAEASDETTLETVEEVIEPDLAAASENAQAKKDEATVALSSYMGHLLTQKPKS